MESLGLTPGWLMIFLGLGAVTLELFIGIETGFDLVLVGIALMVGGGVGNGTDNWLYGVITTTILTIGYIFLGRHYLKDRLHTKSERTNIDTLIGKIGIVEKIITPQDAGRVRVGSEIWRAISKSRHEEGSEVVVKDISGVTVTVENKQNSTR